MIKKTKWILITAVVIILFSIAGIYIIYVYETDETSIELDVFRDMAKNASCSDIANKLFVIDNQMVFWIIEGNCPDASYSYTLFGNNPDEILCKKFDSIAGPQEQCLNDDSQEIFQIIIDNIDADNLGLNTNYKITEIEI
ncbi:hypothetical protein ACFL1L_00980 [Thermoplasmatota archaeon]